MKYFIAILELSNIPHVILDYCKFQCMQTDRFLAFEKKMASSKSLLPNIKNVTEKSESK